MNGDVSNQGSEPADSGTRGSLPPVGDVLLARADLSHLLNEQDSSNDTTPDSQLTNNTTPEEVTPNESDAAHSNPSTKDELSCDVAHADEKTVAMLKHDSPAHSDEVPSSNGIASDEGKPVVTLDTQGGDNSLVVDSDPLTAPNSDTGSSAGLQSNESMNAAESESMECTSHSPTHDYGAGLAEDSRTEPEAQGGQNSTTSPVADKDPAGSREQSPLINEKVTGNNNNSSG